MVKVESYLNYNETYDDYSPVVVYKNESIELGTYGTLEEAQRAIDEFRKYISK